MEVGNFATGIQVNIFAIIVLTIIILNSRKRPDKSEFIHKAYILMVAVNLIMILMDIAVDLLNGSEGDYAYHLSVFFRSFNFMLTPLASFLWVIYVEVKVEKTEEKLKNKLKLLAIPMIVNAMIVLADTSMDFIYYIDGSNVYHREWLFPIPAFFSYLYLGYSFLKILKNKNTIRKKDYKYLLVFVIPPLIGGTIQTIYYGPTLIWTSMAISMLIIFINVQNDQIYMDYLTGLYNKRQLDIYLNEIIKNGENSFGGIMVDVDDFKSINDNYGHVEGDRALECIGGILSTSFRQDDFVARYAGDEFMIIVKAESYLDLEKIVSRLREDIECFNRRGILKYNISLSMGYDIYRRESNMSADEFTSYIDDIMYREKNLITEWDFEED